MLVMIASVMTAASPATGKTKTNAVPGKLEFNRDIRPILSDRCYSCHGPDARGRKANLRLDSFEGATALRGKTQPVVPGDPEHSRILQRVAAPDDRLRMPPAAAGARLTTAEIETLRAWIQQGAEYQPHWAFIAPTAYEPPAVSNAKWVRNPVDAFVMARLDREGLQPSPEADRVTLLRRLSLDLTGLPPTPAEVDAFVKDRSPQAYEKQIDRLMASPAYGERMAMMWMDVARYADSHGYHIDSARDMWPWRDWVIRAFQQNKPYNQFVIEQLAGDLLPDATRDQKIATGFHRNHMINFEGGAIPEEYLNEYVADRAETTSTVFMGLTMGCARCHDHKYDPIKQRDFYSMYAFFNAVPEKGLDGRTGNAEPTLRLSTPEQESRLTTLDEKIKAAEQGLSKEQVDAVIDAWAATYQPIAAPSKQGLVAHYEFDGFLADISGHYHHGELKGPPVTYGEGPLGKQVSLNGESEVDFPGALPFDRTQSFGLALWFNSSIATVGALLQKIDDAKSRRGMELVFDESRYMGDLKRGAHLFVRLTSHWPDNALVVRTKDRITFKELHHLAVNYDGSSKASGLRVFVDGHPVELQIEKDALTGSIASEAPLRVASSAFGLPPYDGTLDDFRIYARTLTAAEIDQLFALWPLDQAVSIAKADRSKTRQAMIRDFVLTRGGPQEWRDRQANLMQLRAERKALLAQIPTVMIMSTLDKPRPSYVLNRGDYRSPGEKVEPAVPAFLPPLPEGAPPNRLALAQWLTDPKHPLTSRVAVNRFWQMLFGTGLVKTAEDFGSQGETPSHPELLDFLATRFMADGWDVQKMLRLMLESSTYRQASRATPQIVEKDPQNRLLSHGPRFRLPAEMIRDNALSASGLLVAKVGGPSVHVYQPSNVWEELAFGGEYSAQTYEQDHGDSLYRRSLYMFAKRTAPHPMLVTFDAPDREKCLARRLTTNTPLQALVLWNDPSFVEAARVLAQRMLTETKSQDAGARINLGFQLATARVPNAKERQILRDLAEQLEAKYRKNPEAAGQLVHVGEKPVLQGLDETQLAAWTMVANAILNMDETITKE